MSDILKSALARFIILKARTVKYILRLPTGNKDRPWRYFYTRAEVDKFHKELGNSKQHKALKEQIESFRKKNPDKEESKKSRPETPSKWSNALALSGERYYTTFSSYLDKLKKHFGIGRSEVIRAKIQEEHKKAQESGLDVSFEKFHASYLEYFKNKEKWDNYFANKDAGKKPDFSKMQTGEKPKKEKGEKKKRKKKPYDKNVLRYLYEQNKPKEAIYAQGTPIEFDREKRLKEYKNSRGIHIATARPDLSQMPTMNYLSEDIQKHLFPHQKDAVNLAMQKFKEEGEKGFILADGTGTGKTRQALALAQTFLETMDANKPIIIVTESDSILQGTWLKEKGDAEVMGLKINNAKINGFIPGMINITTYSRADQVRDLPNKGLLIFDEAHNLKNMDGKQAQALTEAMKNSDHVFNCTATPMDKIEHIDYLCDSLNMDVEQTTKAVKGKTATDTALNLTSLFDDITRKGLMIKREVPFDNLEVNITGVKLSKENQKRLDKLLAQAKEKNNLADYPKIRRFLEEFKVEQAIDDTIKDIKAGKQVVLFAERVSDSKRDDGTISPGTLPLLEKKLKAAGIPYESIYGGTPTDADKKEIENKVKRFQSGESKVIIGNPKSMGTGISLDDTTGKAPRTMRVLTTPYSSSEVIQMLGRINRLETVSKAEAFFYQHDNPVDQWNQGILKDKLTTLGSVVKGEYDKVDLDKKGIPTAGKTKEPPPLNIDDYRREREEERKRLEEIAKSPLGLFFILKARSVKYYKRVPTGNPKRPYEYFYSKAQYEKAAKARGWKTEDSHNYNKDGHKINPKHPDAKKDKQAAKESKHTETLFSSSSVPKSSASAKGATKPHAAPKAASPLSADAQQIYNKLQNNPTEDLQSRLKRLKELPARTGAAGISAIQKLLESRLKSKPKEKEVEQSMDTARTEIKEIHKDDAKKRAVPAFNPLPENEIHELPKEPEKPHSRELTEIQADIDKLKEKIGIKKETEKPAEKPKESEPAKVETPKPEQPKRELKQGTVNPKYTANENQFARIKSGDSDALARFASKIWHENGEPSKLANAINAGRLDQDSLADAIQNSLIESWKKHKEGHFDQATPETLTSYLNRMLNYKINEVSRVNNKHIVDSEMLDKIEVEYGVTPESEFIAKEDAKTQIAEVKQQIEQVQQAAKKIERVRTTQGRNESVWSMYLKNYSTGKPDYRGIAKEHDLTENQVKQIIKNTKNKLKKSLGKEGIVLPEKRKKPTSKLKSILIEWLRRIK